MRSKYPISENYRKEMKYWNILNAKKKNKKRKNLIVE